MADNAPATKQDLAEFRAEVRELIAGLETRIRHDFVQTLDARLERLETSLLSELHDYAFTGQRRIRAVEIQTKAASDLTALQVERLNDFERRLQQLERRLDLGPAA